MSERYKARRAIAGACLVLLGGASVSACSNEPVDYAGIGNEFTIRGVITDSEEDGLVQTDDRILVVSAAGKAVRWFPDEHGHRSLSNEFDFLRGYTDKDKGGFWDTCGGEVTVGKVYDVTGEEIEPEDLHPGEVVVIQGRIRESKYWQTTGKSGYCAERELAVYDTVTVVSDPLYE